MDTQVVHTKYVKREVPKSVKVNFVASADVIFKMGVLWDRKGYHVHFQVTQMLEIFDKKHQYVYHEGEE